MGETMNFTTELENLHKNVVKKLSSSEEQCKALQNLLNECLSDKAIIKREWIQNYLKQQIQVHYNSLKNTDFEINTDLTVTPTGSTAKKISTVVNKNWSSILKAAKENQNNQEFRRRQRNTLRNQLTDVIQEIITQTDVKQIKYREIYKKFKKIESQIQESYNDFSWEKFFNEEKNHFIGPDDSRSSYKIGELANYLFALIDAIEDTYDTTEGFDKTGALGASLEEMLQMLSDYGVDEIIKAETEEAFNKLLNNKGINDKVPAGLERIESLSETEIRSTTLKGNDNYTLEVKWNSNAKGRQGKMDVDFKLKKGKDGKESSEPVSLRISAKNWAGSLSSHDFGSTGFTYAISRTLQDDFKLKSLIKALAMPQEGIDLNSIHKLAKYSLFADILMGYSQESLYADTVVINCQGKGFLVFPLKAIFEEINEQKNPPLIDYDQKIWKDGKLTTSLLITTSEKDKDGKHIKKELNLPQYSEKTVWDLIMALSRIDVAIRYSDIQSYIPDNLKLKN